MDVVGGGRGVVGLWKEGEPQVGGQGARRAWPHSKAGGLGRQRLAAAWQTAGPRLVVHRGILDLYIAQCQQHPSQPGGTATRLAGNPPEEEGASSDWAPPSLYTRPSSLSPMMADTSWLPATTSLGGEAVGADAGTAVKPPPASCSPLWWNRMRGGSSGASPVKLSPSAPALPSRPRLPKRGVPPPPPFFAAPAPAPRPPPRRGSGPRTLAGGPSFSRYCTASSRNTSSWVSPSRYRTLCLRALESYDMICSKGKGGARTRA